MPEPRVELARLYEEHGEPQTALKYLEDAVQQDANNGRAWLALAQLREKSGDLTQALQNYQRALALNNTQPMVVERVAALSRQLNANLDASLSRGGTQIARPLPNGSSILAVGAAIASRDFLDSRAFGDESKPARRREYVLPNPARRNRSEQPTASATVSAPDLGNPNPTPQIRSHEVDGKNRFALQATRILVSVQRNLRWCSGFLGLRTAWVSN